MIYKIYTKKLNNGKKNYNKIKNYYKFMILININKY